MTFCLRTMLRRSFALMCVACGAARASDVERAPLALLLVAVDTIGSDTPGVWLSAAPHQAPVTALRLRFDRPPLALSGDFRVLHAGADAHLDGNDCSTVPGDDVAIGVTALIASAAGDEVTLRLDAPAGLAAGNYRLLICDSLPGIGAALARDFSVEATPRLGNPDFAFDLRGWSMLSSAPLPAVQYEWSAIDADAADGSGSMRLRSDGTARFQIQSDTCIESLSTQARTRFRYRVVEGAARLMVRLKFGFAGDMGEPDCLGPHWTVALPVADVALPGDEFLTFDSQMLPYAWAPRGQVQLDIVLTPLTGSGAEILLDDIGFSTAVDTVFAAGFESRTATLPP